MEAQLIETVLLTIINHQSLIATKAARVVHAAKGDGVMEFGLRRAQGPDAGIYGARAAMIAASSDLDEHLIYSLKNQGATITSWGVGTNLITSKDCPAFGGVYKLAAIQNKDGEFIPKIKLSENTAKVTNPGIYNYFKKICFAKPH